MPEGKKAAKQEKQPSYFEGAQFLLLPQGRKMTARRRQILQRDIEKAGGTVANIIDPKKLTYVIVEGETSRMTADEKRSIETALNKLGSTADASHIKVLQSQYLIECHKAQRKLPVSRIQIRIKPQKVESGEEEAEPETQDLSTISFKPESRVAGRARKRARPETLQSPVAKAGGSKAASKVSQGEKSSQVRSTSGFSPTEENEEEEEEEWTEEASSQPVPSEKEEEEEELASPKFEEESSNVPEEEAEAEESIATSSKFEELDEKVKFREDEEEKASLAKLLEIEEEEEALSGEPSGASPKRRRTEHSEAEKGGDEYSPVDGESQVHLKETQEGREKSITQTLTQEESHQTENPRFPIQSQTQTLSPGDMSQIDAQVEGEQLEMELHRGDTLNPELAGILKEMADYYGMIAEPWRQKTYRVAGSTINRLPFRLKNAADLDRPELKNIGAHTRERIQEWLRTGRIEKHEAMVKDPRMQAIRAFCSVWGIAGAIAQRLYAKGLRNLNDLRKRQDLLTQNQKIGLKYVDDFNEKMSRSDVEAIAQHVTDAFNEAFGEGKFEVVIAGSYRRGADQCGDCDLLVFRQGDQPLQSELSQVVAHLRAKKFLTDDLLMPDRSDDALSKTYFGVCQLTPESKHRRIDIKVYVSSLRPFALLHFTGCSFFNRAMRYRARRRGYTLSDKGLWKVARTKDEKIKSQPIKIETEEDIFAFLNLRYVPPTERLTGDISSLDLERKFPPKRLETPRTN